MTAEIIARECGILEEVEEDARSESSWGGSSSSRDSSASGSTDWEDASLEDLAERAPLNPRSVSSIGAGANGNGERDLAVPFSTATSRCFKCKMLNQFSSVPLNAEVSWFSFLKL